jgi:hypothetical protein
MQRRNASSCTPPDHVHVLRTEDVLDGGEALPGFSCRVADFFE